MRKWYDQCSLFCICLAWCSLSFLGLCFDINLGQIFSHYHFKYLLYSFLICLLPLCMLHLLQLSQSPQIHFFPRLFFPLCFSVLEVSIETLSSSNSLSSITSRLLISISKAFFTYITVFFISRISFWFFLRISIFQLILPICSCILLYLLELLAY